MNTLSTLPSAWYSAPEAFQIEKRHLFARSWMPIGHESAIPEPGCWMQRNLGGWPAFAVRQSGGEVLAFRNHCRHQNMPVVAGDPGHCERLRCRYHGWTYALDGALVHTPPAVDPGDADRVDYSLHRLAVMRWCDFVFACPGEQASPELLPGAREPRREGLGLVAREEVPVNANWKLVVQGMLEGDEWRAGEAVDDGELLYQRNGTRERLWAWPGVSVTVEPGRVVIHQVVPRTFRRTEFGLFVYAAPDASDGDESQTREAYTAVAREAEARYEALENGEDSALPPPSTGGLSGLILARMFRTLEEGGAPGSN